MWENAFYEGADDNDTGVVGDINGVRVGSAVCWEFIRTQTARRMTGKVDVIIGGSHWWSPPSNWPNYLVGKAAAYNNENLMKSVQETARLIGAPVIHASHCNTFSCKIPGFPFLTYHGVLEGNTAIVNASGKILARRRKEEGEVIVTAKIILKNIKPSEKIPDRFWLRYRSLLPITAWYYQGFLGRRWYKKNVKTLV